MFLHVFGPKTKRSQQLKTTTTTTFHLIRRIPKNLRKVATRITVTIVQPKIANKKTMFAKSWAVPQPYSHPQHLACVRGDSGTRISGDSQHENTILNVV